MFVGIDLRILVRSNFTVLLKILSIIFECEIDTLERSSVRYLRHSFDREHQISSVYIRAAGYLR